MYEQFEGIQRGKHKTLKLKDTTNNGQGHYKYYEKK
jgi:hypothetical protein